PVLRSIVHAPTCIVNRATTEVELSHLGGKKESGILFLYGLNMDNSYTKLWATDDDGLAISGFQ
uniref:hypothetical protein n=1 Tax=Parendozoicomonas sp. Alg238-R29 TaxID=2993446 RepID=UPI00248DDF90